MLIKYFLEVSDFMGVDMLFFLILVVYDGMGDVKRIKQSSEKKWILVLDQLRFGNLFNF